VVNLSEIIKESEAVMVARGDLGQNIPLETLPFVEVEIIEAARAAGRPVITATEMLVSMVKNSRPTRAEVTDVAYAITNGSDAVMLSEETAIGEYPVETIMMMEKIVMEAERRRGKAEATRLLERLD
jgi:pyruvate kinase